MEKLYATDVDTMAGAILRELSGEVERTAAELKKGAGGDYTAFCYALKMLVEAGFIRLIEKIADHKGGIVITYRLMGART